MRYVIIGAGAVGATIGGLLHRAGSDVLLVARGAHHAALREHGLRLATPERTHRLDVPVVDGVSAIDRAAGDIWLVATKIQHAVAALDEAAALPGGEGPAAVVCAQNGVAGERMALRRFPRVYGMRVWLPASYLRPGAVAAAGSPLPGMLDIGRYPAGVDACARRIADDLTAGGFDARAVPDVMRWKYAKLLDNLGNALEAVAARGAGFEELFDRAVREGRACLAAAGIEVAGTEEQAARRGDRVGVAPVDGEQRSGGSSWQSLARGTGSIEADYLNGEIALLGRLHGVPTPVNDALQELAGCAARDRRAPASLTVADVAARIAD